MAAAEWETLQTSALPYVMSRTNQLGINRVTVHTRARMVTIFQFCLEVSTCYNVDWGPGRQITHQLTVVCEGTPSPNRTETEPNRTEPNRTEPNRTNV